MTDMPELAAEEFTSRMFRMWNEAGLALMVSVGHRTGLNSPVVSPDGRFIAALNAKSFHVELYRVTTGQRRELTRAAAGFPTWSSDSRSALYLDPGSADLTVSAVDVITGGVREVVRVRGLRQPLTAFGRWIGAGENGSILAVRDFSSQEIFALHWRAF